MIYPESVHWERRGMQSGTGDEDFEEEERPCDEPKGEMRVPSKLAKNTHGTANVTSCNAQKPTSTAGESGVIHSGGSIGHNEPTVINSLRCPRSVMKSSCRTRTDRF
ncbi:hypothetical protein LshimejAT787_0305760 [Lyophyllum shimeji]|uniref:Uncharacterized protein n=1 Tax=Lyophyllum shimeji TaxID=47721 RepID=A0A9P3PIX6_LYOSH|nr:hypothetical protein LshimejAT787_0305760 [Lyophyllum shimeji]